MDEEWLKEFAPALEGNTPLTYTLGYHTAAIVNRVSPDALELSIYLTHVRFHEIKAFLPRNKLVVCVARPEYSIKPHIFVNSSWLNDLYLHSHSVFAIFDAIGAKSALARGEVTNDKLRALRDTLDRIAEENPSIALVSFADSLLVKSNYQLGQYNSSIKCSYDPDALIRLFPQIKKAYRDVLGLDVYAIATQGLNAYDDGSLLHISRQHNHISVNSLGMPFAQLLAIEGAVRVAIRKGVHEPTDLYMDKSFYHSLAFERANFDKHSRPTYPYESPIDNAESFYFAKKL